MNAPEFWWRTPPAPAYLLWPGAWLWGRGAGWRMTRRPRFAPPVPVLCVGNYVVGGAGKTPTVIALAAIAMGKGLKPGILSRGYGARVTAPILVDPDEHTADEVGDEPLLLARAAPTVVAPDRAAGAARLVEERIDLILLDDGFQDPSLAKDVALAVVDTTAGVGNGNTVPLGPLRAPLALQISRSDALLVVGDGEAAEPVVRAATRAGKRILTGRLEPVAAGGWRGARMLAFAGIARPQKFFDSLAEAGAEIVATRSYGDHHMFTDAEASAILAAADATGARLVTTAKDATRLVGRGGAVARLNARAEVLAVTLEFDDPAAAGDLIAAAVDKARARAR